MDIGLKVLLQELLISILGFKGGYKLNLCGVGIGISAPIFNWKMICFVLRLFVFQLN